MAGLKLCRWTRGTKRTHFIFWFTSFLLNWTKPDLPAKLNIRGSFLLHWLISLEKLIFNFVHRLRGRVHTRLSTRMLYVVTDREPPHMVQQQSAEGWYRQAQWTCGWTALLQTGYKFFPPTAQKIYTVCTVAMLTPIHCLTKCEKCLHCPLWTWVMVEYYDVTVKMTFNVPDINGGVVTSTFYSLGQLCEMCHH